MINNLQLSPFTINNLVVNWVVEIISIYLGSTANFTDLH